LGILDGTSPYYGQSYVKAVVPSLPATSQWRKGILVKESLDITKGTVIATFNANSQYHGHAAIYEKQTSQLLING
jgi:hypothetical protein